ncbi:MAG: hypothetical protein MUF18_09900 [Fimbriiglobus sp.]|jgi:hypothetical protein|nr:hypothetical protein [Fimbriiglobus sp.]
MFADWLEIGRNFGLILVVWFALVGWKLVPAFRGGRSTRIVPSIESR